MELLKNKKRCISPNLEKKKQIKKNLQLILSLPVKPVDPPVAGVAVIAAAVVVVDAVVVVAVVVVVVGALPAADGPADPLLVPGRPRPGRPPGGQEEAPLGRGVAGALAPLGLLRARRDF